MTTKTQASLSESPDDTAQDIQMMQHLMADCDLLESYLNNAPIGFCMLDEQLRYRHINPTLAKMNGLTVDDHIGRHVWDVAPHYRPVLEGPFQEVLSTGKAAEGFEIEGACPADGQTRKIWMIGVFPMPQTGGRRGLGVSVLEITARKQAERSLAESEERFRLITEAVSDLVWDWNIETGVVWWNDRLRHVLQSATPTTGIEGWKSRIHPMDNAHVKEGLQSALESTRNFWEAEYSLLCNDGTYHIFHDKARVLRDGDGKAIRMVGAMTDITEKRKMDDELVRLGCMVASSGEAIIGLDLDGTVVSWNPAAERIHRYSAAEMIGRHIGTILPPERHPIMHNNLGRVRNGEPVRIPEVEALRKDRSLVPVSASLSPLRNASGDIIGIAVIAVDLTDHNKLENQLRQTQKMEAIGQLAGGIAHDFNNLLTVILGYSQMMLAESREDDPSYSNIKSIVDAGQRAVLLTRKLLTFSRKGLVRPRILNLNDTLRDISGMLRTLMGEDIDVQLLLADDLGQTKLDPVQLEQVVMNLAANARDAMPLGGRLTIATLNSEWISNGDEDWDLPSGGYVTLTVSDTGCGMPPEVQRHVFEPFFTTKGVGKGTGLGLSTVYGIVKQNGGDICLHSVPDAGATFEIRFRRLTDASDPVLTDEVVSAQTGNETILLVEDDLPVRQLATHALDRLGYTVCAATDVEHALKLAQTPEARFDLLLTDVVMPQMNGKDLWERIRRHQPDAKVLFMSGYPRELVNNRGILDPRIQLLEKPFTRQRLAAKVREALSTAVSPV